jgi:spoIIIJ-associated protein
VSQTDEAALSPEVEPSVGLEPAVSPQPPSGTEQATETQEATDTEQAADTEQATGTEQETPAGREPRTPGPTGAGSARFKELEREGDIAADFLEELLDIADLDGDIDLDVEGDRAMVAIVGEDLDSLVGPNGKVLEALQELTRLAVHQQAGERSRLILDVADYRANRRKELALLATEATERVRASGEPVSMKPMTAFERKVVHDAVAAHGLVSESEGVDPQRYVVVRPAQ